MCLLFSLSILVSLPPFYLQPCQLMPDLIQHLPRRCPCLQGLPIPIHAAQLPCLCHIISHLKVLWCLRSPPAPTSPIPHLLIPHSSPPLQPHLLASQALHLILFHNFYMDHALDLKYSLPSSLLTHCPHCPSKFSLKLLLPLYISSHSQLHLSLCLALDICGINHDPWHPS